MAHDQQVADSPDVKQDGTPDARVAGAVTHWGNRFTANGTDYADFAATLARITRWADWCREWGVTATRYEQLAEAADDAGQRQTAAGAWQRAALAWHWGKFVFTDDPVQQRAAHDRAVACFFRAAPALTPPAELVRVPYGGTTLAAYLRVPPAADLADPPVVIMVPGLDSLAVDGPGQGEAEYELPIEPAYEKVATAVVEFLQDRAGLDADRIGLFGVSLGGYYAARAAAYEKRLRAVVSLAGPYRLDLDWDDRPAQTRATFQARSGARSAEEARAKAAELTLEAAAPLIETPLLVVGGARDTIAPAYHQERLAQEAKAAELALYPDGNHGVTNRAYESRSRMADWLAAHLNS